MIPYGRQDVNENDIEAVASILRSDFLTQGPTVEILELALGEFCGASHVVAVNSATSALHIACLALGLRPGSHFWTSPNTFVATANAARLCGADVRFVDINERTYNLDAGALEKKLEEAKLSGSPLPDVVGVVDFAGQPCDVDEIQRLSQRYNFKILEDASHAIGATWRGKPVGCNGFADITVFSFHPVKIITTGEGGAALTHDSQLASRMRRLRSHGIDRPRPHSAINIDEPWQYSQVELGFNYRLSDIHAALGISQLQRAAAFLEKRRAIAARYDDALKDLPLIVPFQDPNALSAYHLYPVMLETNAIRGGRKAVFSALRHRGIGVQVHYIPVHTQPYYQNLNIWDDTCINAEKYYSAAISLPIFPKLTEECQSQIVCVLRNVISELML